ncbi:Ohr family peroxiredoxin [Spirillospora sp. NPDC047279]|uniref:Ohr family peroxiredoxin n=1 Tax=Spirillospora sp. NPDC047279 TaxID=3155478 RepID=UPI0033DB6EE3
MTEATTVTGRGGSVATTDGRLDLDLSAPAELGGDSGPGTNPEQLFAAGYAACFNTALRATLTKHSLRDCEPVVSARVGIFKHSGGYRLEVAVSAELPGIDREEAERYVTEADLLCPFSDALRGNAVVSVGLAE